MKTYIIGCGGGGSWAAAILDKMRTRMALVDGDTFTDENRDRQLFSADQVGMNKAMAMANLYPGSEAIEGWFPGEIRLTPQDILFCCADNHACRKAVLEACDRYRCRASIAANEYTDAEAYWYEPSFKDTPNDPRIVYPSINTDQEGNPLAPIGCTGAAALEKTPQLVLANIWAAGYMLHLWWFHTQERKKLADDTRPYWPVHHKINKFGTQTTIALGDRT